MKQLIRLFFTLIMINCSHSYGQQVILKTIELNSFENLGVVRSEYDYISAGMYNNYYKALESNYSIYLKDAGVKNLLFYVDVYAFRTQ